MEIKDMTEGKDFVEIKDIPVQNNIPDDEDLSDILSEKIRVEKKVESQEVNADDFTSDFKDKPAAAAKDEKKDNPVAKEEIKDKEAEKNAAATRLFQPDVVLQTYNAFTGRIGAVVNKKNPDCLKFDDEDTKDIGILLKNTAEEEGWSRFPTKWLLIFLVAVILVGKILMWNKPKQVEAAANNNLQQANQEQAAAPAGQDKLIEQMNANMNELREQNRLMQALLDKKIDESPKNNFKAADVAPEQMYKGYDLEKISFTEKGALVDPDKAGQKGYTDDGKKVGLISHADKDVHRQWKLYQKFIKVEA